MSSSSDSSPRETTIELTDTAVAVIDNNNQTAQSDSHEPEYFIDEEEEEPIEHHDDFDIQVWINKLSKFHASPKKLLKDNYGILILCFTFFIVLLLLGTLADWNFTWEGWMVWVLIWLMAVLLGKDLLEADAVFTLIMTLLLGMMIIDPIAALSGFANEGVASVVILFVVAKGVQNTGGLEYCLKRVLGQPKNLFEAQARLVFPVAIISAFLHNTPLVAMMMPVVETWSRRMGVSSARFMLPLSYAAIIGGTCTILGTSNNLVVTGLWQTKEPDFKVDIWEMGKVGWPLAFIGAIYITLAPRWLLSDRVTPQAQYKKNPREYCVAVSLKPNSSLSGKTIEEAHLRGLKGLFLIEIQRPGETIEAPSADTKLQANDVLVFSGMVSSVQELFHMDGLAAVSDQAEKLRKIADRRLYEVVISANSSMVGLAVKKAKFRTKYGAAIIAVHRFGERVKSKIGDIVIQPGDTFLLESKGNFLELHADSENFALVAEVADYKPIIKDKKRMWIALFLMAGMIVVTSGEWMDILACCMCVSLLMILCRCMTLEQAKKSIKMKVVIAIATVFGLGQAVSSTGIALQVANSIVSLTDSGGALGLIFGLYIATVLMCQLISNHAALVVMFPIAYEFYTKGLLARKAVLYTLMFAGSADFSTPFGYQTNLMVTGVAGYHFVDFVKMGVPLQVICCLVSVFLIYWNFQV